METLTQMYARHEREMKNLMDDQQISWDVLNERYGKGKIPADVYQQWDQQHGNTRLHGLRAQQEAEAEAYPLSPLAYRYQQEAAQKAASQQPNQPSKEQAQPAPDNKPQKYYNPVTGKEMDVDSYQRMQARIEEQKRKEAERKNRDRSGPDLDR